MLIVSFSVAVPFEGIPHAGGEYYLHHVRALLAQGHDVHVVVLATPDTAMAGPPPDGTRVHLIEAASWRHPVAWGRNRLSHFSPEPGFIRGLLDDDELVSALRSADLVEFQWSPTAALLPAIEHLLPVPCVRTAVVHDVVAQSTERRLGEPGLDRIRHALRSLRARLVRQAEPAALNRMDLVLTFSEKDRVLLQELGVGSTIEVVRPPLALNGGRTTPSAGSGIALFVGAFDRVENATAARWLLDAVWPRVLEAHPSARLRMVGNRPTTAMLEAAATVPSVEVTGFVEDVAEHYRAATMALVPLLLGSGVKFKTVTAMTWGLPVISTTVGVEGIIEGDDDYGVVVVDDGAGFADAILAVYTDPEGAFARADRAREWALSTYGADAFARSLTGLYATALGVPS